MNPGWPTNSLNEASAALMMPWDDMNANNDILPSFELAYCPSTNPIHYQLDSSALGVLSMGNIGTEERPNISMPHGSNAPQHQPQLQSNQRPVIGTVRQDLGQCNATDIDRTRDWMESLFDLNTRLGEHRKSVWQFVQACQKLHVESTSPALSSDYRDFQKENGKINSTQTVCPLDQTVDLAMDLRRIFDEVTQASRARNGQYPDMAFLTPESITDSNTDSLRLRLEDKANSMLLFSCYARIWEFFYAMLSCFHKIAAKERMEETCSVEQLLTRIHPLLPCMQIECVPIVANSRFQLAVVLSSVETLATELHAKVSASLCEDVLSGMASECIGTIWDAHSTVLRTITDLRSALGY